jgi:spoIIIJ-associated protein
MEWVVTTGRSVEEAVDHALDQLGVDENEIEYEVVDEGTRGLLGRFGARPARIRARVRPVSREKPDTRRRRRRSSGRDGGEDADARSTDAPRAARGSEPAVSGAGAGTRSRPARSGGASGGGARGGGGGGGGGNDRRGGARSRSGGRSGDQERTGGRDARGMRDGRADAELEDVDEYEESSMGEPVNLDEQARVAEQFVDGLTRAMKLPATVSAHVSDDVVHVDVQGTELGLLIGPRGATIEAVHELVKSALQRHTGGQGARVTVDVAGYRERRRQALEAFVQTVAERALESGRDQVLDPMNSADRKIVHDAVATIDGIVSESQGEEPRRRVVIKRA